MAYARVWILVAGLMGATGVALGAYHAHGLSGLLERQGLSSEEVRRRMDSCAIAARYQMYHALALVGVGMLAARKRSVALTTAGGLFAVGTLLFSGGLYWIAFGGHPVHWAIVPAGGLALILAWIALAIAGIRYPLDSETG